MLIFTIKESDPSGDKATARNVAERRQESESVCHCVCHNDDAKSTSTQTERKTHADISTQTVDSELDLSNESIVVIAEEVFEDTVQEEPLDNQTNGIVTEDVVITENYEDIMFKAEWVEITDNFEINQKDESRPSESGVKSEIFPEATVPLNIPSDLPKLVADCVEVVLNAVSQFPCVAAVKPLDPPVYEAMTEDSDEGAGDVLADGVLIETTKTESNANTQKVGEATSVASSDDEPLMETILGVVCEDIDPKLTDQDIPIVEFSLRLVKVESTLEKVATDVPGKTEELVMVEGLSNELLSTEDLPLNSDDDESESIPEVIGAHGNSENTFTVPAVKVESDHEDITTDEPLAVEDIPGKTEELNIMEGPPRGLISTVELLEVTDDQMKSIPEITITEESIEVCEDLVADLGPKAVGEAEPTSVIVKADDVETPEAAVEALSQSFIAITPPGPTMDVDILLEEEVIVAPMFVPLYGEQKLNLTISEEPRETISGAINEVLSNKLEVVPADKKKDLPQTVSMRVSGQEELKEADVLLEDAAVEDLTGSNLITSEEPSPSLIKTQGLVVLMGENVNAAPEGTAGETERSGRAFAAHHKRSEGFQPPPSYRIVEKCFDSVLATIEEEPITEDKCSHVTSKEVGPEVNVEEQTEENAENGPHDSKGSETDEDTGFSTDMEVFLLSLPHQILKNK